MLSFFYIFLIIFFTFSFSPLLQAKEHENKDFYSVYCADEKIEVDLLNLQQMKSARGSNVCKLQKFESASSAEDYAKKIGGKGANCSCK